MSASQPFLVYRDELLGPSETFILGAGESLSRFRAFYVGLRRRPGLRLPESRVHIISELGLAGKLRRARFKLLGPSRALQSTMAAIRPILIHAHFGPDGCNAMAMARTLNVPLVVTLHGYDVTVADRFMPRLYVRRRGQLKLRAARFICVSEFIRQRAIALGFPPEKLVVHYTGIDVDLFRARPEVSRSALVLFVGRLVPKKGCEYLIRAMARVQKTTPHAALVVIGNGPLREPLQRQAAVLKNCRFLGEQKPSEVRDWMNRAMVFSTPSVIAESGDSEGFGMIFAEAQAMGLPVVSFASGGIPEAVAHGESGFLVKERDEEALAAKLLLLLGDRYLWTRMSEAGEARARQLFDIRKQGAILEDIYDNVLSEWNGNTRVQRSSRSGGFSDQCSDMATIATQDKQPAGELTVSSSK